MSYWDDPVRKAAALRKRAATRAELGPRLGQAPFGGHRTVAPTKIDPRRRRAGTHNNSQHPTRDTPA